ncbi:MAG: TonB-dependent receptor [Ignavibacteriae bacterium]|nr:TonB-dependent receptor [Ignavibacteriota bacterium]
MNKFLLAALLMHSCCILGSTSFAAESLSDLGSLRGFISDSINGEAVVYANVLVKGTTRGATSTVRGYYFIPALPMGKHTIRFSHVGFRIREIVVTIAPDEIAELTIALVPVDIRLDEMVVTQERATHAAETDLGIKKITSREIEMTPPGFESDIFRVLQSAPGVSTTGDVTAKYYVRGGGSDQNLLLLNGATIYNPFHALGIYSVIDPEMISAMEFQNGGFATEYGGRLSSILTVTTRDGNKNRYGGSAQASFLSGKLAVEGPLPYGSFLVTGRKSYNAKIFKNYLGGTQAPFDFYDLSFKVNYANPDLSKNGKFMAHGFLSDDRVMNHDLRKEDYVVRNAIAGANWNKVWSSPLYSNLTIAYSGFTAEVLPNLSSAVPRTNAVRDISLDAGLTYVYQNRDELSAGVQTKSITTQLQVVNIYGRRYSFDESGSDLTLYAEYKFYRWDTFGLHLGTRVKPIGISKNRPNLFEPRFSATYRPSDWLALKAAAGWYSQEMITLADENELISIFEPWIIVPDYVDAQQAAHFLFGITTYIGADFTVDLEAYYKSMIDLVEPNTRKYTATARDYVNTTGKAYGCDLLVKFQSSHFYAQTSYSLSWSFKTRGGVSYAPRYDTRHAVHVLLGYSFLEGWQASASWTLKSGMPFTPIIGFYDRLIIDPTSSGSTAYEPATFYGAKNSTRLPVYHRLDLSLSKEFRIGFTDIALGASIINVYDRKNIFFFDRDTGQSIYMLRFSPSLTLKVGV